MPRDLAEFLKNFLLEEKPSQEVLALYLYGSALREDLRLDSDIDIGLLTEPKLSADKRLLLVEEVIYLISKALKEINLEREVSVCEMRGEMVPLPLLFSIVTEGKLIYERGDIEAHLKRVNFENYIIGAYIDFLPFYRESLEEKYEYKKRSLSF